MKAYTWSNGKISSGLVLAAEFGKKKELSLILGKAGPGSHYEALSLHRLNPPLVKNFKVEECDLFFIPVTRQGGFFLLSESVSKGIIVRTNTSFNGYSVKSDAHCEIIAGAPKERVAGNHFDNFAREDSLWEMQAGDALRIKGCLPQGASYALWIDEKMQPHTACFKEYLAHKAVKERSQSADDLLCATVYNWRAGNLSLGIAVKKNDNASFITFGEGPFADFLPVSNLDGSVLRTAVLVDMATPGDRIYGLRACSDAQENIFLLSVSTEGFKSKNSKGSISAWKGNPEIIFSAKNGEDFDESLVLMREGDVLCIEPQGDSNMISYAVYVKDGKLVQEQGMAFKKNDLEDDPDFWLDAGWTLRENLSESWIGQIISCYSLSYDRILSSRYGLDCYSSRLISCGVFQGFDVGGILILKECHGDKTFECLCDMIALSVDGQIPSRPESAIDNDLLIRLQEAEKLLITVKDFFSSPLFPLCDEGLKNKVKEAALYSYIQKRPLYELAEKKSASLSGDGSLPDYCRYLRSLISECRRFQERKRKLEKRLVKPRKKKARSEVTIVTPLMSSGQMTEALRKAGLL